MEKIEQNETPESRLDYEILKNGLLHQTMSLSFVHLELIKADQATPTHEASEHNLSFLEDKDIKEFVFHQPLEIQERYHLTLGFTQWHVAQRRMLEGKEDEGVEMFRRCLESSMKGKAEDPWLYYAKGTIAYFENNALKLEECAAQLPDGSKNKAVLERLLSGLRERGAPEYKRDYQLSIRKRATPPATATFRDSLVPFIGISATISTNESISSESPSTSFPNTNTTGKAMGTFL